MENLCNSLSVNEVISRLNDYSIFEKPPDDKIPDYPVFIHYLKRMAHKKGLWERHGKKVARGSRIQTFNSVWVVERSGKKTLELREPTTNNKFTRTWTGPDGVPKFYIL